MARCIRCGRKIKSKNSIERGYGNSCAKHMEEEKIIYKTLEDFGINDKTTSGK